MVPRKKSASKTAAVQMDYAGFWLRFAALLIDSLLLSALFIPVFALLLFSGIILGPLAAFGAIFWMFLFLLFTIWYEIYFIGKYGATYGKKWLEIKVVNKDGNAIGYEKAFIRWLGRIVVSFTLLIGYLIIPFTEHHQGLHDIIARTYVVKGKTEF